MKIYIFVSCDGQKLSPCPWFLLTMNAVWTKHANLLCSFITLGRTPPPQVKLAEHAKDSLT